MPKKISSNIALDDAEDEILFTRAALKADPDAAQFLPATETWLPLVDDLRGKAREVREQTADADATRIVANVRLDEACTAFGDQLFLDVGKDRNHARWRQFFSLPVSRFVRIALRRQVNQVRGWLSSNEPLVQKFKPRLEQWSTRADQALIGTSKLALARGELAVAKGEFAEALTHERDGLYEALSQFGREKGLGRSWGDAFFRTSSRSSSASTESEDAIEEQS